MTKKDFKDDIEMLVIAFISAFFVMSMNKKCSNVIPKETKVKIEKVQNIKKQVTVLQKIR